MDLHFFPIKLITRFFMSLQVVSSLNPTKFCNFFFKITLADIKFCFKKLGHQAVQQVN